jgi:peptidoglycan hydrolase CwlO-like protein
LRGNLNDDNKKSQLKISQMKKNYEDLQKEINDLNSKLDLVCAEVDGFKEKYNT